MKTKFVCMFLAIIFSLAILLFSFNCSLIETENNNGSKIIEANYSREYWGEWLRMDTGENWYISNKSILVNKDTKRNVSLKKQSDRVIEVTEEGRKYYLFASRVNNGRFTGSLANMLSTGRQTIGRTISGIGGINITIGNLGNSADSSTTKSDDKGVFVFEGTPGDNYIVTVDEQNTVITPNANGDDIGTITVTNGLNFKVSIKSLSDLQSLYAGIGGGGYDFTIEIENTGTEDCTAAQYNIVLGDGLTLVSGLTIGLVRTIEPGKKREIPITLKCDPISNEYVFKKLAITIEDSFTHKIWEDSVSIKFNQATVNFTVKSQSPVNGIVITPNGKAYHFQTDQYYGYWAGQPSGKYTAAVAVPWSDKDFLIVFSGAVADTETVYAFGVNSPGIPYGYYWAGFLDAANFEPNNTESNATTIQSGAKILSYLHKNDIDYYRVNIGNTTREIRTVAIKDYAYAFCNNTSDRHLLPGRSYYLDIEIQNTINTFDRSNDVSVMLSSDSTYVTVDKETGSISGLGFSTAWGKYIGAYGALSRGSWYFSSDPDFGFGTSAFKFTLDENCPHGTQLPFVLTFTDKWNNVWHETLQLTVE